MAALAMASCGGDDQPTSAPTPAPSPTPTPTPTPSPPPTPTPTSSPGPIAVPAGCPSIPADRGLVFDQVVSGIGASLPSGTGIPIYPPTEFGALSFLSGSNAFVFRVPDNLQHPDTEFDGSSVLAGADLIPASSDATVELRRNQCTPFRQAYQHSLLYYRQGSPGSRLSLVYSSMGRYAYNTFNTASGVQDTFFVGFGSPTPAARLPRTGTVTYRGEAIITGHLREVAFNQDYASVADVLVTVDYLAGTYRAAIDIGRVDRPSVPGSGDDFGVVTFDNASVPGLSRLRATQNGGSALGFLSGPSAEEVVMTFTFTRPVTFGASFNYDATFAGSLVARR